MKSVVKIIENIIGYCSKAFGYILTFTGHAVGALIFICIFMVTHVSCLCASIVCFIYKWVKKILKKK